MDTNPCHAMRVMHVCQQSCPVNHPVCQPFHPYPAPSQLSEALVEPPNACGDRPVFDEVPLARLERHIVDTAVAQRTSQLQMLGVRPDSASRYPMAAEPQFLGQIIVRTQICRAGDPDSPLVVQASGGAAASSMCPAAIS